MKRRSLLAAAAAVLACAGLVSASAIADTAGSSFCTPAHTVQVDGNPVSTISGECVTAPTVTVTVTTSPTTPTTTTTTGTTTTTPSNYLFDDEFNGPTGSLPSSTLWGVKTGSSNGSAHWNGWSQISENGQGDLAITAQKINGVWQSGFLSSKTAYSGSYRQEVRAKLACGQGVWNAPLWSWGAPYGASPSIEVDGNEQLGGQPQEYHATLHNWNGGTNPQSGKPIMTGSTLCNTWHVFADNVYADHVDFYMDGTLEATIPASAVGLTDLTVWREVSNIDLNMGGWAGTIGSETSATLLVDYIRVTPL